MAPMTIAGVVSVIVLTVGGTLTLMNDDNSGYVHHGTVVSCTNSRLVMTEEDGTRGTHLVTSATSVTRDGEPCEARDLMSGTRVRVTTEDSRERAAIAIEAFVRYAETTE